MMGKKDNAERTQMEINSLTVICVRITGCFITPQQTVKATGSIKVTGLYAKAVHIVSVAQTVRTA